MAALACPRRSRFVNDLQTTLFWLRLVQLLLAIPLFALAGQGATGLLARMMGQPPQNNFIYRLFALVASPEDDRAHALDHVGEHAHAMPPSVARRDVRTQFTAADARCHDACSTPSCRLPAVVSS